MAIKQVKAEHIIEVKATDIPNTWLIWWWPTDGDDDVEVAFQLSSNHPNNHGFEFRIREVVL